MDCRQLPPSNLEAEMSILGGIFISAHAIDTVHELLKEDDFYRMSHRKIFAAMASLHARNEPIDLVTMVTALKASGDLEEVGGGAYLSTLVDYVPTAANIAFYCKSVAALSIRRRLITETQDATKALYEDTPTADVIASLETAITVIPMANQSAEPVSIKDALRTTIKGIEHRYENRGKIQGIPYGIPALDRATNGMQNGDLIIIAGRPSMGKSALAGNLIESACLHNAGPTLMFSLEMSKENQTERMLASHGMVSYYQIRSGNISEKSWDAMVKASSSIHDWPWLIDDTPGVTFHQIRARAKRQKRQGGLSLIVIDYLQIMGIATGRGENRATAIGSVTRGLKQLARELDVPVVLLSQLSRELEKRPDKRPVMSDLRESGEIEQDSDVILFPYRPAVYCALCRDRVENDTHSTKEHESKAEIIIEKQRNGSRNISVPAIWLGDHQKFFGME